MKTRSTLAEFSKEGCSSKSVVLAKMIDTMLDNRPVNTFQRQNGYTSYDGRNVGHNVFYLVNVVSNI